MQRQPHAALDIAGRQPKAQKIHALLSSARDLKAPNSPASWLEALAGASPTHIYLLTKDGRFDR